MKVILGIFKLFSGFDLSPSQCECEQLDMKSCLKIKLYRTREHVSHYETRLVQLITSEQ